MHDIFEELLIAAPGEPGFYVGTLNPILVEWDTTHPWDSVLTDGVISVKIMSESIADSGTTSAKPIDLFESAHDASDFICAIVGEHIANLMATDPTWYNKRRDDYETERAMTAVADAIDKAWATKKTNHLSLVISDRLSNHG